MCYQWECSTSMPVKPICLVLAILRAIGSGLALLAFVIVVIVVTVMSSGITTHVRRHFHLELNMIMIMVICGLILLGVIILMDFIFCVLLCNGICKRRPGQVMAFFIYGVIITVIIVLSALGSFFANLPAEAVIGTLIHSAFYSLFLLLVHQTYFTLLEEAPPKNILPLGTQPQKPFTSG